MSTAEYLFMDTQFKGISHLGFNFYVPSFNQL